uniref:Chromo domain-containing protein n=1 Tax=Ascaris lumbricoides TaxID=6252 RepID=A0A9J2QCJ8_ASCLU
MKERRRSSVTSCGMENCRRNYGCLKISSHEFHLVVRNLEVTCKLMKESEAEILSIRMTAERKYRFYVHYLDCNRRLDEWVEESALDLSSVRFPQKGGKIQKTQAETASSVRHRQNEMY